MSNDRFNVKELRELYDMYPERLERGKKRQSAVWLGEKPDYWPIAMAGELTDKQQKIPDPDISEAFNDADMMLCQQMRMACRIANGNSDAVPSIRANTGTGTLLSCLGLEQEAPYGQMPWLKKHYTREQVAEMSVDDINIQGTFASALDFIAYFKEIVGDLIDIYCVDTQGPFDLAHLLLGDEVFYLIFEDPELLHHTLELCTELYIQATKATKAAIGEDNNSMVHGMLNAPTAGVRICEDTTTLIGNEAVEEFALPYTLRAAGEFGGAWIHFCGRCDILRDIMCEQEEVKGMNYGIVPSKEYDFDFDKEIKRMAATKTVYHGDIPRLPNESGKDYLRRLYDYCESGYVIPKAQSALGENNGFESVEQALDFWYS